MVRLVRKQVYITPEQDARLKRLSRQFGVSEADLVRRGIDRLDDASELSDEQAWQAAVRFMRERGRLPSLGGPRTWTREELYEERLDRPPCGH